MSEHFSFWALLSLPCSCLFLHSRRNHQQSILVGCVGYRPGDEFRLVSAVFQDTPGVCNVCSALRTFLEASTADIYIRIPSRRSPVLLLQFILAFAGLWASCLVVCCNRRHARMRLERDVTMP